MAVPLGYDLTLMEVHYDLTLMEVPLGYDLGALCVPCGVILVDLTYLVM